MLSITNIGQDMSEHKCDRADVLYIWNYLGIPYVLDDILDPHLGIVNESSGYKYFYTDTTYFTKDFLSSILFTISNDYKGLLNDE